MRWRLFVSSAAMTAMALAVGACGTDDAGDGVTLTILVDSTETTVNTVQALADAFTEQNPNIRIELETRPQGSEGDNVVKTRLQTGEMTDLFYYNSGSLLQALAPQQALVDLSGEPFMDVVSETFRQGVSAGDGVYGVPVGNAMGGGILYNRPIYEQLDLDVPTTWDAFMANSQQIRNAGLDPVIQTYGADSTWTSQLFVLGDYYNVEAEEPGWADDYTANQAHYSDTPAARAGFEHLQEVFEAGYLNADFGSATYADGLQKLVDGEGAHYPMLTFAVTEIKGSYPDKLNDVGFFAIPGDDADNAGMTTWLSAAFYLPQSTENVAEAKQFLAFVASPEGCDVQTEAVGVTGPYFVEGCTLPADLPQAVQDLQTYFDSGLTFPALEFLSPVKGPRLEQITVEVGSGISSAVDGAALYDEDVKQQAQQLGLEGW
ncbi:MAG TPA: ABC transporter substrate-binding protein [Jiangellales bacterium]|nr:ABC transporter substrate-binding protein [Jiangellales bacterium]